MPNEVEIANGALVKIGSATILSLDDDSKAAQLCKLRLGVCRSTVLRMHPWNCAIKRVTLSPLVAGPAFGFTKQFQLPTDCLRVLRVNDGDIDYRIEGRNISCDETTIELQYVADVPASLLDAMCAESVSYYLAWDISYALTSSMELKQAMWQAFQMFLSKARFCDATENPAESLRANLFIDSRDAAGGFPRDPMT